MKSGLAAGGTHIWYAPRTGESKTKKARTRNFSMTVLSPHGLRQPDSNSHLAICQVERAIAEWKCRARNKTSLSSWLEHGHRISDVAKFLRSDQANISMMLLRAFTTNEIHNTSRSIRVMSNPWPFLIFAATGR